MPSYPFDLGRYGRAVFTRSSEAQVWFDRGLNWCYGFNHEESIKCWEGHRGRSGLRYCLLGRRLRCWPQLQQAVESL